MGAGGAALTLRDAEVWEALLCSLGESEGNSFLGLFLYSGEKKKKNQRELKGKVPPDSLTRLGHFIYRLPWSDPEKTSSFVRGCRMMTDAEFASATVSPV